MVISAALLAGLAACSLASDEGSNRTDNHARSATAHRSPAATKVEAGAATTREDPHAGERTVAGGAPPPPGPTGPRGVPGRRRGAPERHRGRSPGLLRDGPGAPGAVPHPRGGGPT